MKGEHRTRWTKRKLDYFNLSDQCIEEKGQLGLGHMFEQLAFLKRKIFDRNSKREIAHGAFDFVPLSKIPYSALAIAI